MGQQGQGNGTPRKETGFFKLFRIALRVMKHSKFAYWHADLNAGSGHNEEVDCAGSPVVFLMAAVEVGAAHPTKAYFCDLDQDRITQLRAACTGFVERLADGSEIHWVVEDNGAFLHRLAHDIREQEPRPTFATGTILCDPNGFPDGCPVDALDAFFAEFWRLDLILNLNASLFRMVEGCKLSSRESIRKGFVDWPTLAQLLPRFHKNYWFIRNPSRGPGFRFVTFYGHNNDGLHYNKFEDFFPLESRQGHDILHSLQWVNPEQPLFEGFE